MSTVWELCLFCQEEKRNENVRAEISSYAKIETQLKKFVEFDATYFNTARLDDGTGIAKTLDAHNAVYHKKCYDNIGDKKYNRLVARRNKKSNNEADSSGAAVIPHKRTKVELGKAVCLFCGDEGLKENLCAAGELHSGSSSSNSQHVENLTASWRDMALAIGDLDVHAKLCVGDIRSNEVYYHKIHLVQFRNRYRASQTKKGDGEDKRQKVLLETYAWKQISNYIHESTEQFIAANVLEKKYAALMDSYNLSYTPHSTRFMKLLKENVAGLNDSKLHGVNYVSLKRKTGKEAEELLNPQTLFDMMERVSKEIRIKLRDVKNEFNGSFVEESPLPCELLIFLDLLMNGSNNDETVFSLPVKALAQFILYNHRNQGRKKESTGDEHQQHNADKESPFLLYIGLKVFAATRSSQIIDVLYAHGLCVSYDRILRITQGLGEALLQLFEDDDAAIPGLLRTGLFTIGAKDNIDKNVSLSWDKYLAIPISIEFS